MPRRTGERIVADVLKAASESGRQGISITALLLKANVTHTRMRKLGETLISTGLMAKVVVKGRSVYMITPKGQQRLEEHKKFYGLSSSFGLEL